MDNTQPVTLCGQRPVVEFGGAALGSAQWGGVALAIVLGDGQSVMSGDRTATGTAARRGTTLLQLLDASCAGKTEGGRILDTYRDR